jgi:hypothetical protein
MGMLRSSASFLALADEATAVLNEYLDDVAMRPVKPRLVKGKIAAVTLPEYDPAFTEAKVALLLALDYQIAGFELE